MAINFTVSYSFSPNTTIQSSQVNTNFSDNANVWTGLEAKTKSFSNLQVDATTSSAADVVRKDYVDGYASYRRPILVYNSTTVVNIETGINGTSGAARVLFPDGNMRTDSTTSRIQCNLAQVAATSGSAQSGLRTGTVAVNTWYAVYAVKVTDNSANFVAIADVVLPLQANYATLNSNFGTNGWVYLGLIRNGDNSGTTSGILKFVMSGSKTIFTNEIASGNMNVAIALSEAGLKLATTAGATTLTYFRTTGTGTTDLPDNIIFADWLIGCGAATDRWIVKSEAGTSNTLVRGPDIGNDAKIARLPNMVANNGLIQTTAAASSIAYDTLIYGFVDSVLGVGANPIL